MKCQYPDCNNEGDRWVEYFVPEDGTGTMKSKLIGEDQFEISCTIRGKKVKHFYCRLHAGLIESGH